MLYNGFRLPRIFSLLTDVFGSRECTLPHEAIVLAVHGANYGLNGKADTSAKWGNFEREHTEHSITDTVVTLKTGK